MYVQRALFIYLFIKKLIFFLRGCVIQEGRDGVCFPTQKKKKNKKKVYLVIHTIFQSKV
jgi:hypothetical protein